MLLLSWSLKSMNAAHSRSVPGHHPSCAGRASCRLSCRMLWTSWGLYHSSRISSEHPHFSPCCSGHRLQSPQQGCKWTWFKASLYVRWSLNCFPVKAGAHSREQNLPLGLLQIPPLNSTGNLDLHLWNSAFVLLCSSSTLDLPFGSEARCKPDASDQALGFSAQTPTKQEMH